MPLGKLLKLWARRIKRDGVTLWFAAKHPRTPWYAKALGAFVVAYALSPIDLIPDFIPVLGYVDDVLLLPALIWLAVRLLPADVRQTCRQQADDWMCAKGAKPRSRFGLVWVPWRMCCCAMPSETQRQAHHLTCQREHLDHPVDGGKIAANKKQRG